MDFRVLMMNYLPARWGEAGRLIAIQSGSPSPLVGEGPGVRGMTTCQVAPTLPQP